MNDVEAVARDVDRLFVTVHAGMRSRRSEVREWMKRLGLSSPVLLVDMRPLLLAGLATRTHLEEFARFGDPVTVAQVLEDWRSAGAVEPDRGRFVASDLTLRFLTWTTDEQATIVDELWSSEGSRLGELSDTLRSVLDHVEDEDLILFSGLSATPPERASIAFRFHHQLTVLRYLRSDRHVAQLRAAGIPLPAAKLFDALRTAERPEAWLVPSRRWLVDNGWLDEAGDPTERGRSRREAIDVCVDGLMAEAFAAVPGSIDLLGEMLPHLPDVVTEP